MKGIKRNVLKPGAIALAAVLMALLVGPYALSANQPQAPATYDQALKSWRSIEDINQWIGTHFSYDQQRAARLSESQRARLGPAKIYSPPELFGLGSGVCVDLARFGVESARRVEPAARARYLMLVFDPVNRDGNVFRRHWLAVFQRQGKWYSFADSRRPGYLAGPFVDLAGLVKAYQDFSIRQIVNYKTVDSFKRKRKKRPRP